MEKQLLNLKSNISFAVFGVFVCLIFFVTFYHFFIVEGETVDEMYMIYIFSFILVILFLIFVYMMINSIIQLFKIKFNKKSI